MQFLTEHEWPGNVRQLENVCRWITVMAPAQVVSLRDMPEELNLQEVEDQPISTDWTRSLGAVVDVVTSRKRLASSGGVEIR